MKNPINPKSDFEIVCWFEFYTCEYNKRKSEIGRLLASLRGVKDPNERDWIMGSIECARISAKHYTRKLYGARYGFEC